MTVSYKGLDCLADKDTAAFMMYHKESQAKVAWMDQPHYGKVTVYFGVATIFLALLKHVWFRYTDRRYSSGHRSPSGLLASLLYVITGYCRFFGYIPTPKFLVKVFSFPSSIGNLLFAISTSVYLLCYCLVPHFWYRACRGFGSPPLAVRAGIMSTALTPFIFVLAGKSNTISMLTGIGYEKLNWLHQFISLASCVLAIIHTIPFIQQALAEGGTSNLANAFTDNIYINGIPPLVLLILLCSMFRKEIRKYFYELSFHFHWMMGCGYFGTLMYHVYKQLNMERYLWATLALWMSQLLYRLFTSGLVRPRPAEIRKLDETTFEITIHDIKNLKWKPGQHVFLRFPGIRVFDNHPFSIASVRKEEHLKFVIVPGKGLTRKLFEKLDSAVIKEKVMVDGPYGGTSREVSGFDNVLLFATGSGVTVTLPYLTAIAQSNIATQEAHFVWIIRNLQAIEWIHDELERVIELSQGRITIDIYNVESQSPEKLEKLEFSSPAVSIHYGKPNILEVGHSFQLSRRNLIVSSGSESMRRTVNELASELQTAVISAGANSPYVEEVCLHSETFGW
ncbi:CIC11C00000004282 [Sungouiella intermedia]|uniref:ferric-chelate reductase (NADPH) n=1 Tax=Sungouiella intermedia TaxID=45354 RepID=A0A1L0BFK1_9ASCO|nr:CIC11C00000004282 [[Candida] intermedia]